MHVDACCMMGHTKLYDLYGDDTSKQDIELFKLKNHDFSSRRLELIHWPDRTVESNANFRNQVTHEILALKLDIEPKLEKLQQKPNFIMHRTVL